MHFIDVTVKAVCCQCVLFYSLTLHGTVRDLNVPRLKAINFLV